VKQRPLARRRAILRLTRLGLGGLALLQVLVLTFLSGLASWRKRRERPQGFPHETLPPVSVGRNTLQVFSFGQDLFDDMLRAIDAAQESIYLETFLWKGDAAGQAFKEHLIRKAKAGVAVYVVFDGFGNLVVRHEFKVFPDPVHALEYRPIHQPWQALDPRRYALDHRKLLVVDGHTGFVGGYNLGGTYATEWRDTHVRVDGPAAAQLAQAFVDFWNDHRPRAERITRHYPREFDPFIIARSTDALRLSFPIRDMYIAAIDRAERRIRITNAYFMPDSALLAALIGAAERGVDVQLLVPWNSNHPAADWLARGYFTRCLRSGVRVFAYHTMIHAKTCTIDGQWSTIGTANLDRLSSVGNFEINLEIYSPALAAQMDALFAKDKANASELTLERWRRRPLAAKAGEVILEPLRALL
jgi:cardiolipin synthase A/B